MDKTVVVLKTEKKFLTNNIPTSDFKVKVERRIISINESSNRDLLEEKNNIKNSKR